MSKFTVRLPKVVEFIETEVYTIEAESAEEAMRIVKDQETYIPVDRYEDDDYQTREYWHHEMTASEVVA